MKQGVTTTSAVRVTIALGCVAIAGIAGVILWKRQQTQTQERNERAHAALMTELGTLYTLRQEPKTTTEAWSKAADSLGQAITANPDTSLTPYLKALRAEALARAGEHGMAISGLEEALKDMAQAPVLSHIYQLKLGQMLLESNEEASQTRGKDMLLQLAQNTHIALQGVAWYQLHHYAVTHGDAALREMAVARLKAFPRWQQVAVMQTGLLAQ